MTWADVILALAHPAINSAFQSNVNNAKFEVPCFYSLAAMINLVTALTNSYPDLAIKLFRKVAEKMDKFGYNTKSSVIADYRKINLHKKKLNLENFAIIDDNNGTSTFLNLERDALLVVKLLHHGDR